ncbi:thiamine phosphate synthase [Govanella unica]|uniref:Thiamine-phosphate synthase n=1 Tax=Govanella unica TaxID=2975056 RepID=A0A9X3Z889_9PROT|nr:thiamine phosphate synthase [Govania unica]
MSDCRLYLITPPAFDPRAFAEPLKAALGAGDVASLQLRLKDASADAVRWAAEVLMPITQAHDVAFIVNDRPDLAREVGADGVHIGQEDACYEEARKIVGPSSIVGVTCHNSRHLAMVAGEKGADYVAFGAFFPTNTKIAKAHATPDILSWWAELFEIPCVAIGGIRAENANPLVQAGADFIAVSAGVWDHPEGPATAVQAFNALFHGVQ